MSFLKIGYGLPDEGAVWKIKTTAAENRVVYEQYLERLRKKAKSNGLTEKILEQLLDE